MTEIESEIIKVEASDAELFSFLSNLNNHQKIMPSQVTDWWSTDDEAKMKLQGLGTLHLKKDISRENSYLKIVPIGAAPVDLYIEWHIFKEDQTCKAQVIFFAQLNVFMKMVAEKPLKNLANFMANKLNDAIKDI